MPLPAGALLAAGATALPALANSVSNFFQSRRNTDRTNAANMRLAQFQYSKDLEMWNRTNEYNSPENQMLRLKAAGLNPNLVYGNQGGVAGNAPQGSMPKFNAPTAQYNYSPLEVPSMIGMFQDIQMRQAQIDNLREQRNVIRESAVNKNFLNEYLPEFLQTRNVRSGIGVESDMEKLAQLGINTSFMPEFLRLRNEGQTAKNILSGHAISKLLKETEGVELKNKLLSQSMPYQLSFLKTRNQQQKVSINNILSQMGERGMRMSSMEQQKEFTQMKMDWYIAQTISKIGADVLGSIIKFTPAGRAGTILRSLNQKTEQRRQADRRFDETTKRMRDFGNR